MSIDTQVSDSERAAETLPVARVLVVDDERSMRELLSIVLRRDGYDVLLAPDGKVAVDTLKRERVDVLITDIRMPDMNGVDVLREAKRIDPEIISIIMTAFASTDTAVDALRLGAADYVHKSPNAVNDLRLRVRKELERKRLQQENVLLKRQLGTPNRFANIVGGSSAMMSVFELIETIAPTGSTVLITGESGTGKELVARAIHARSSRSDRPFVAVNCGALPDTLLESELFGHVRGAFTGADTNKKGLLEVAEKGTIFLDEIGEMSAMTQVKLLRVLQDRKFRRLGGTEEVEANIRIIAATNRDLAKMVAAGDFREDLFYRINVIPVKLPPLREREGDRLYGRARTGNHEDLENRGEQGSPSWVFHRGLRLGSGWVRGGVRLSRAEDLRLAFGSSAARTKSQCALGIISDGIGLRLMRLLKNPSRLT